MKFSNPNMKKIRGAYILIVYCAFCKYPIAKYQKIGKSNLVKMYNDRITQGNIDFSKYHGVLLCPNCSELIATRYITKTDKKEAYRLKHGCFNIKTHKGK